ncbi:MAG: DUF4214 domain-containing protein [Pseudomonas sp.]|uniref:DUF4214 domain-containing protein n=1 Tax=Pseudomonas sp. TaxID=306 RepID=UPI003D6FEBE2
MTTIENQQLISSLYVAAFGRAADKGGLAYWTEQVDAGLSYDAMITSFLSSQEGLALVGSDVSDQTFLDNLYGNVLSRAPDTAGAAYWQDRLDILENRTQLIKEYLSSITSSGGTDAQLLSNKIESSLSFAASASGDNLIYAKSLLSVVTSDPASVATAKALNDIFDNPQPSIPPVVVPPVTITPKFVLHEDTGTSATDGITKNGAIDVTLPTGTTSWEFTADGGQSWTQGTGTSFSLAEGVYAAGLVNVRYEKGGVTTEIGSTEYSIVVDQTAPSVTAFINSGFGSTNGVQHYSFQASFSENVTQNPAFTGGDATYEYQSVTTPLTINSISGNNVALQGETAALTSKTVEIIIPTGQYVDAAGNESSGYINSNFTTLAAG